jgi:Ribbon-helix-helix protein, copG family
MGKDGDPVVRFELPPEWSNPPKLSSTPQPTPDPSFRITGWTDPAPNPSADWNVSDNRGEPLNVRQKRPARARLPCRLTIRLPIELIAAIDERCEAMDQGASQLIRSILAQALQVKLR